MGFPVSYSEHLLPKIFLYILSFLGLIRKLISIIFRVIGLPDFLEPDPVSPSWPDPPPLVPTHPDPVAILAGEILPVVRFSDHLKTRPESECCCSVCLDDYENDDEIRRLTNCRHIFHRRCLDRWMMSYNQMTCPTCRTHFLSDEVQMKFKQKLLSEESDGVSEVVDESY